MLEIREASDLSPVEHAQLVEVLIAVVDEGAAVGFMPPLDPAEAADYWRTVADQARGPHCALLVAEEGGMILGSAQLHLVTRPNSIHRADVAKVMVHPTARRRGLGRAFMERLETVALREGRTLLVLDTRAGDPSNELYLAMGYQEAGRIPDYARSGNGELHTTVIYFKQLGEQPHQ